MAVRIPLTVVLLGQQNTEDLNTYTEISNMFSITNSKGSEYIEI